MDGLFFFSIVSRIYLILGKHHFPYSQKNAIRAPLDLSLVFEGERTQVSKKK